MIKPDSKEKIKKSPLKKKPIVKENIIYKDVVKENIIWKDVIKEREKEKIITIEKEVVKELPVISNCIICNAYPKLMFCNYKWLITCENCKTQIDIKSPYSPFSAVENLFPSLYEAMAKWNELGAHLIRKTNND